MSSIGEIISTHTLSTLIGVIAGAILTFMGQWILARKSQKQRVEGALQVIYEELNILHMHLISPHVESSWEEYKKKKSKFFARIVPISRDYSTTYNSNVNLIGQIKNSNLRRKIVETYMVLRVLVDTYAINNKLLNKFSEAESKGEKGLVGGLERYLQAVAPTLEVWNDLFKEFAEETLVMINKERSPTGTSDSAEEST